MLFAIYCTDKPDSLALRLANRADHLAYMKSFGEKVVFGSPTLADDGETMNGSCLIVEMDDKDALKAFLAHDPYAKAGLFSAVEARPLKKVFG